MAMEAPDPSFNVLLPDGSLRNLANEGRARLLAGDDRAQVVLYLRAHRMPEQMAGEFADRVLAERTEMIRHAGRRKCRFGVALIALPFAYNLIATPLGYWRLPVFLPLAVIGTMGIAKLFNGVGMITRPQRITGSVWRVLG